MPTIVHFDIPADDPARARQFYSSLFNWTFEAPPGFTDYYLFTTTDSEGRPATGGGLGKRGDPDQRIVQYIGVESIDRYLAEVTRLGGKVVMQKMPVPSFGYLAHCQDTEGNIFGLWEEDASAR